VDNFVDVFSGTVGHRIGGGDQIEIPVRNILFFSRKENFSAIAWQLDATSLHKAVIAACE
jgi:hypothetical protein